MRDNSSKAEYVELNDYDYSFLPPNFWDHRADFDTTTYCVGCGRLHTTIDKCPDCS